MEDQFIRAESRFQPDEGEDDDLAVGVIEGIRLEASAAPAGSRAGRADL